MTHQVACGVGHTLFLVDPKDAEGLPTYEPKEVAADPAGDAKKRKGGPAKGPKKAPKKR